MCKMLPAAARVMQLQPDMTGCSTATVCHLKQYGLQACIGSRRIRRRHSSSSSADGLHQHLHVMKIPWDGAFLGQHVEHPRTLNLGFKGMHFSH